MRHGSQGSVQRPELAPRPWADTLSHCALIVEDGTTFSALPAVRSLSRAGWTVGLGVPGGHSRARGSRFLDRLHVVPRPEDGLDAFTSGLRQAIADGGYDVVFPGDDSEVLALSLTRASLPAIVPYPSHEVVVRALDKLTLTEAARAVGLAVPETVVATAEAVAVCEPPIIVKAQLHWTPGQGTAPRYLPVHLCKSERAVRTRVAEITGHGGGALLQEALDGSLIAFSAVIDRRGRLRTSCQQRTTAMSSRGTSVRAESTGIDPDLAAGAAALLQELGWFGLANLQFLVTPGQPPKLIDLNPRYYGSMALAIAAGADLPAVWADLAVGGDAREATDGRAGHRYYALQEDLKRLFTDRSQPTSGAVRSMVRSARGAAHPIWAPSDPGPGILAAGSYLPRLGKGAIRIAARVRQRASEVSRASDTRARRGPC